jgi:uncharacterized protein YciI
MNDEEEAVWAVHFERLQGMLTGGTVVLAGPTLGPTNTGIVVFEADEEDSAHRITDEAPVIVGGFSRGALRPFRVSLLRSRD